MAKTISTVLNLNDKFSDKLNKAKENIFIFKKELQNCEKVAKNTDKALDKMGSAAKNTDKALDKMGSAADKKMDEAGKKVKVFGDKLKSCDGAVKNVNKVLGKLLKTTTAAGMAGAAGMGAFAKSSLDTYKDFQQSMSNVAGISGITAVSEDYKKLETAAREAGKSTTKTAAVILRSSHSESEVLTEIMEFSGAINMNRVRDHEPVWAKAFVPS